MACGKAGSAALGQSRAPAPLYKEAKLSTPRFAERQRLGGSAPAGIRDAAGRDAPGPGR